MVIVESVTARAIITIADRVLLAQGVDDRFMHLPGGHVEAGELPANALRRELREELGRDVGDLTYLGTLVNTFDRDDVREQETMYVFQTRLFPELFDHLPASRERHLRFAWVPMADLRRVNLLPPALDTWILRVVDVLPTNKFGGFPNGLSRPRGRHGAVPETKLLH